MDLPDLSDPQRLWWLLALPLLYWLSRPLRPRRLHATPHLRQWLRARERLRRRPIRFRWLRFLLLAMAFTAAVLAHAGPRFGARPGPRALVILLDASASMGAGRVWQEARARIAARLLSLPAGIKLRLSLCASGIEVLEGDTAALLAGLPARPVGAGRVDLGELARSLVSERTAVWTLGDGLGPTPLPELGALTRLGRPAANVAITALAVDDHWPLPEIQITLTLANTATTPRTLTLEVAGVAHAPVPVELPAATTRRLHLELRRGKGGPVTLRLRGPTGALAADDLVAFELPAPPAPDIAVLAEEASGPWMAAARALASETGGRVVKAAEAAHAGFLLVEGGIFPQPAASMRFLTFGTRSSKARLAPEDLVTDPVVLDWDRGDEITKGLDLSDLEVRSCLRSDFIGSGKTLVRAEHGPLIVVDEGKEFASVHASFRLSDSNFALLPAFPQFLRRCFARSYRQRSRPHLSEANLLSAAESNLTPAAGPLPADRPLRPFGRDGTSLVVPLLLLALGAMALRVYV